MNKVKILFFIFFIFVIGENKAQLTSYSFVLCAASSQYGIIFDDYFNITVRSITTTRFEMIVNRVDSNSWAQDLDAHWVAFEH